MYIRYTPPSKLFSKKLIEIIFKYPVFSEKQSKPIIAFCGLNRRLSSCVLYTVNTVLERVISPVAKRHVCFCSPVSRHLYIHLHMKYYFLTCVGFFVHLIQLFYLFLHLFIPNGLLTYRFQLFITFRPQIVLFTPCSLCKKKELRLQRTWHIKTLLAQFPVLRRVFRNFFIPKLTPHHVQKLVKPHGRTCKTGLYFAWRNIND